jgi:superoxide dismutase, Cu-Zn family
MITRLPAALALCVCASACVSSYNTPRPAPPAQPPSASATASGSGSGHTQATGPKATQDPKQQDPKHKDSEPQDHKPADGTEDATNSKREVARLEVEIQGKSKSQLLGTAELTDVPGGVKVVVHLNHVKPGMHGVHIHEFPDCSADDARSAGGHFNPENKPHALPSEKKRHLGDLGNIVAKGPDGTGRLEIVVPEANLVVGSSRSLLNRSLVVHADMDDGTRQPGGNSGDRIGCAELTIAAGKTGPGRVVRAQ